MVWALVFVLLVVVMAAALNNSESIPWVRQLRRLHAGAARKAEWMAPEEVVAQVRAHYLETLQWMQSLEMLESPRQPGDDACYLDGACLKRFRALCGQGQARFAGVLRADHQVQVRYFSEDGRRCLVIDRQTQRRMATYDRRTGVRLHTQDLGDGAVVYQMVYDGRARRWKIETFIQELPSGLERSKAPGRVLMSFHLPAASGRDS